MIIAVTSPHTSNNGNTLTSILTAVTLADLKKKVFLSHTSPISESFYSYLGLRSFEDKTSTPTQLVKLIKQDAIKAEDIKDYCKEVTDNLDVFTNDKTIFSEDDMFNLMECVLTVLPYDFAVIDVDTEEGKVRDYVLEKADVVIINLTQSVREYHKFNKMKEKLLAKYKDKIVVLVCTKYNATIGKDKDVSENLGVKTRCNLIHYNPWLTWGCNTGRLMEVVRNIRRKDFRVLELQGDLMSLASTIVKCKAKMMQKKKASKAK